MAQATSNRKIRRTGGLRAKAWWVLRRNKSMTVLEIQNAICDGTERSAKSNLGRWLVKLVAVGVLETKKVNDGILTSNGSNLYTLVKDLGPIAPIVRGSGDVFDPNTQQIVRPKQDEHYDLMVNEESTDVAVNCI